MRGAIWVHSEVGRGSTFEFTIRLALQLNKSTFVLPSALQGLSVLVVDDHGMTRESLEAMLENWAMLPTIAASRDEALIRLRKARDEGNPFAVLLADWNLGDEPGEDGMTLLEHILREDLAEKTRVVVLAPAHRRPDTASMEQLRIAACLTKPVLRADLRNVLQATVETHNGRSRDSEEGATRPRARAGEKPPTRPARILLVEDDSISQEVVATLLQNHGHQVIRADNGRQALEVLARERVDLVVMDVQMPEMNGIELTAAIRARDYGKQLPILALTAHAIKGDRERFLKAGMDDYLCKPVRPNELFAAIDRHAIRRTGVPSYRQLNVADVEKRVGRNRSLLTNLVRLFASESPPLIRECRAALECGDAQRLRELAHRLKGSASYFSTSVAQRAADVERLADSSETERRAVALDDLAGGVEELIVELQRFAE
jgi:CheY-like chemotaxis protein